MEAGLNVVIEKPMAVTSKEAEYMAFSAQKNNVRLCVIHNHLFMPAVLAAKSMIAKGKIGNLISVHADMRPSKERLNSQSHWYHSLPGGILHEFAPHVVYMSSAFLGKIHPVGVISQKLSQFPWVNADELKVMVESENRIGIMTISFNQPRFSFIVDIYGSKGTLRIDNVAQTITFTRSRSASTVGLIMVRLETLSQLIPAIASISIRSLLGQKWYKLGHQAIIQGFIESIRENKQTPITEYDGLETTKVIESILNKINI